MTIEWKAFQRIFVLSLWFYNLKAFQLATFGSILFPLSHWQYFVKSDTRFNKWEIIYGLKVNYERSVMIFTFVDESWSLRFLKSKALFVLKRAKMSIYAMKTREFSWSDVTWTYKHQSRSLHSLGHIGIIWARLDKPERRLCFGERFCIYFCWIVKIMTHRCGA